MSVLAIDIGNTRVGLGVFLNGKGLDPAQRILHGHIDSELPGAVKSLWQAARHAEGNGDSGVVIAGVVPALTAKVKQIVRQSIGAEAEVAGEDFKIPLKLKLRDESTVGVDRLLGALSAYVNTESACVIVSVGTALVVDCIDADGVFLGGAIAPGLALGATALHEHAALLPKVTLTPPPSGEPFGTTTQGAINLGLYVGARGAVRELIERYAAALGSWPHVVATGGDARTLLEETSLVDSLIPDLVLQGAALAWEHHHKDRD